MIFYGRKTLLRSIVTEVVPIIDGDEIQLFLDADGSRGTYDLRFTSGSDSCTVWVTIDDDEEPTFTCPPDLVVNTAPGQFYTRFCCTIPIMRLTIRSRCAQAPTAACCTMMSNSRTNTTSNSHIFTICTRVNTIRINVRRMEIKTPAHLFYSIEYKGNWLQSGKAFNFTLHPTFGTSSYSHGVVYKVWDVAGNTQVCNQTITVVDAEPPTIVLYSTLTRAPPAVW